MPFVSNAVLSMPRFFPFQQLASPVANVNPSSPSAVSASSHMEPPSNQNMHCNSYASSLSRPEEYNERTRIVLTSAAYVHLKHLDVSKHTRNLSPASQTILLSGPAELYQQALAKALAQHFDAKLLLLDLHEFSLKMQGKYNIIKKDASIPRSISEATLERMSSFLGSFSTLPTKDRDD